ncbi:anti-sigma regulatory factor (Ser/Thr protein kinase) [Streptomyces sp. TLI_235]|nr:ATP-binding protein [Streptomyces sp. TLI_235]PBC69636.1 anti-sigma regulatory factor (Ser/Thr protein kinase) [Streptomyces sp. TLI_235]
MPVAALHPRAHEAPQPWCCRSATSRCVPAQGAHRVLFPPRPREAGRVRRYLRSCVAASTQAARLPLDEAELVVTEMFSNAVNHADHAESPLLVAVNEWGCVLRLEVHDPDPYMGACSRRGDLALSGRGLLLIASLSRSWGVLPSGQGKLVYAEIAVGHS